MFLFIPIFKGQGDYRKIKYFLFSATFLRRCKPAHLLGIVRFCFQDANYLIGLSKKFKTSRSIFMVLDSKLRRMWCHFPEMFELRSTTSSANFRISYCVCIRLCVCVCVYGCGDQSNGILPIMIFNIFQFFLHYCSTPSFLLIILIS